ncbi:MAG TPA: hypothetical protein VF753_22485 [Terriglobales bacterium]
MLIRVTRFNLLLIGPGLTASPSTEQAFQKASANLPVLHLGDEFSGLEAAEATSALLEKIAACLNSSSSAS